MVTFVAVENPAGLLGFKQRGVLTPANPLLDFPLPHDPNTVVARNAKAHKVKVYDERQDYFLSRKPDWASGKHGIAGDLIADSLSNREVVTEIQKRDPTVRVLMSSSVNSLTKYIVNYCQANAGTVVDKLIIFGHGGADSMNVGLGRIGGITDKALKKAEGDDEATESLMKIRGMAGMSPREGSAKPARTRYMGVDNSDRWVNCFSDLAPYVGENDSGYFTLFLMACSIASKADKPFDKSLVKTAAQLLAAPTGLNLEVAVAAPKQSITYEELFALIDDLPEICWQVGQGKDVSVGEVPLLTSCQ